MSETCPVTVASPDGWRFHRCGKPVKRRGLCGIHAGAQERIEKKAQERRGRETEARKVVDRLATHGIPAYVSVDGTPVLSMSPEALADLLDDQP